MAQTFALALKESGLTEREFAAALGLSHDQVNRYKRNATTLPAWVLIRTAAAIQRSVDDLVAEATGAQAGKTQAERIRELEEGYRRLAEGQQRLARMLDTRVPENV